MAVYFLTNEDLAKILALLESKANKSDIITKFPAEAIISGVLPIKHGGTSGSTAEEARENLGIPEFIQNFLTNNGYNKNVSGTYTGTQGNNSGIARTHVPCPFTPNFVILQSADNIGIASKDASNQISMGLLDKYKGSVITEYQATSDSPYIRRRTGKFALIEWEDNGFNIITEDSSNMDSKLRSDLNDRGETNAFIAFG